MKLFDDLTSDNFELFAAKYYTNPACLATDDFYEDLAKFKYVVRLFRRYRYSGEIKERLVLNHIIGIYNVFQIQAATRMLFYKIDEELWPTLKTILIYLNYLPPSLYSDISIDLRIANNLKDI